MGIASSNSGRFKQPLGSVANRAGKQGVARQFVQQLVQGGPYNPPVDHSLRGEL